MAARGPAIACIGVIGRHNNPLHISLFPAEGQAEARNKLEFSFMLSTCLDIFEARMPAKMVGQDFGLLQAIDERLAMYGWLTNTGIKLVIVVDMTGRAMQADSRTATVIGLRNSDLTPVFHALQKAYIRLLRNPFYAPDAHSPGRLGSQQQSGSTQITSRAFIQEVDRLGRAWNPDVATR